MLESLFGNRTIEKILFFLLKNQQCYARQLHVNFAVPVSSVQNAFDRLENGNILVCFSQGRTRLYRFNPRYPFYKELIQLLEKAYRFLPEETKLEYYEIVERKRPRKRGKPL